MVEIKSHFGDWHFVGTEQARKFITTMLSGMNCGRAKGVAIINEKHLRGITVQELLEV